MVFLQVLGENVWIALTLFIFVWIFSWAKKNLGSAALGVIFAIIVVYLTFYSYPQLVWLFVGIFILATFGKEIVGKINPYDKGDSNHLR